MSTSTYFSASYPDARRAFLDAAAAAGARIESHVNPAARGPSGEELATDVAWLGPADASRVLVTISGTHGAEGFAGAGIQTGTFRSGVARALPADTALLAIHAINPYGFAWMRRVTEENVDLNRNFVAHDRPLPANAGYVELADAICPREWTTSARANAQARLDAYVARHGAAAFQQAVSGGQYTHPDGIFYGGRAPSWSRRTLLAIAASHLAQARRIARHRLPHRARPLRAWRAHRHPPPGQRRARPRARLVRRRHHLDLARHLGLVGCGGRRADRARARARPRRGHRHGARIRRAPAEGNARRAARRQLAPRPRRASTAPKAAPSRRRCGRCSTATPTTGKTRCSRRRWTRRGGRSALQLASRASDRRRAAAVAPATARARTAQKRLARGRHPPHPNPLPARGEGAHRV